MKKLILLLIALGFCLGASGTNALRIVAKVNDEAITAADLEEYYNLLRYRLARQRATDLEETLEDFKETALLSLIEDRLIVQKAKSLGGEVPAAMVNEKLKNLIDSFVSYAEFEQSLVEQGLTVSLLKEKIREQYLIREIVNARVRSQVYVFPAEVTQFYNDNKDQFKSRIQYRCWIARFDDAQTQEMVRRDLEKDGFEAASSKHKEFFFLLEQPQEGFKKDIFIVVNDLEPGSFTTAFIDGSHFIVFLEEVVPSYDLPLDSVKDDIHLYLFEEKFTKALKDWVEILKEDAVIEIYEEE